MWFDVIGNLAAVGLLVIIPMEIVEVRKNKKAILESNRKRIEAMEKHRKLCGHMATTLKSSKNGTKVNEKRTNRGRSNCA